MVSIRQCCITVKARLSYIYFLSSAGNYSLLQQAFRRKSVFSDEVFRRKSVFFSWSFRRKSVFLQWKNQRKSVDMLYRKIEKYIVTHLQSESDKILIVDGSYGKLRVSLCWTGGARVLPLWCRGAALSGTDVFSMSIQCFKFLINPNSPYDNIYCRKIILLHCAL